MLRISDKRKVGLSTTLQLTRLASRMLQLLAAISIFSAGVACAANVTSVSSSTTNGSYKAGQQISIQIAFSSPVTVTGSPRLLLETGASDANVSYSSGSGTSVLTFVYPVAAGHSSSDLDYQSATALGLNGGRIRDESSGDDATLTLPTPGTAGSLGANSNLIIDTTAPIASLTLLTPSITNTLPIRVQISFSESVTGFSSTDISVSNGSVTGLSGSGASYTATVTASAQGTVTVQIPANSAADTAGNGNAASTSVSAQYDTTAPSVTNVTSSPSTGAYRATQAVNIILTFSESVIVSAGTPSIALSSNSPSPVATYLSGSGTSQLTFRYTISSGDSSEDLDYASTTALSLNGASLRDQAGNSGILTLPTPGGTNSLAANSSVAIDTTLPSVEITSLISGDTALDAIPVTIVFSEAVTGFSLSDLSVSNGCASNLQGSGATYTADIVPRTNGLVTVTVPAAVVVDRAGNTNSAAPVPVSVNFSTYAPRVTTVTSETANGAYRAGQTVSIQVAFSEAVVVTGTPQLRLATGSVTSVDYLSGSGTDTLTFLYTIAAGQNSSDLDYIPLPPLTLNGGQILDAATESIEIARTFACPGAIGSLGYNNNIVVDTVIPSISRVTSTTADGSYRAGQTLNIQTQFSESVYVTGTPLLTLETGASDAVISMISGSGSANLNFNYTIIDGHNSNRLDYQSISAFGLNGAIIQDLAGNLALVTLPATGSGNSLFGQKQLVVDTIQPTVPNVTSTTANGSYKAGSSINVMIALSEVVFVTGSPRIQLATGLPNRFATYLSGSGTNNLNFTYTVVSGDTTSDLDYISAAALDTNGGSIRDLAGNDSNTLLATPGSQFSLASNKTIVLDTTSPTILSVSSTAPDGAYAAGSVIPIRVSFSEPVNVLGSPYLRLNTGPSEGIAYYSSGSGSTTLTFSYTVQANENSNALDYTSSAALILPAGSSIRDTALNDSVMTLPSPGAAGSLSSSSSIIVDTLAPTVSSVTSTTPNGSYRAGSTVDILVELSEPVFLTGTLNLVLASGSSPNTASCTSLRSATTLSCSYTVQSGDSTNDLDYQSTTSLTPGSLGSGLADTAGNLAVLTLVTPGAPGSLGAAQDLILDTASPAAILSSSASGDTNVSPVPLAITFSEPVTGLTLAAFSTTNASIQNLAGSGAIYSAELIPTDQGSFSVTLKAGTTLDPAGNANLLSNTLTRNYDTVRPTVTITSTTAERSNASSIPLTVTFSESVSGFDSTDIGVTNGTVSSLSGSGADYSAIIIPNTDGDVVVSIAENVSVDAAQNGNLAAQNLTRTIDRAIPRIQSVTTSIADGAYAAGSLITIDIVFNEPVQLTGNFTLELATNNGVSSALCSEITVPTTLRCSYTVATGDTSADLDYVAENSLTAIAGAKLFDLADNAASLELPSPGLAGSLSASHDIVLDTTRPIATLSSAAGNPTNTSPIEVTVTFNESVTGVSPSSFTVTNGSISSVSGSGSSYSVQLTPGSQGAVTIEVVENGARDRADNGCSASSTLSRTFDSIRPEVTLPDSSSQASPTNIVPIQIEFSEPVAGFEASDIVVTNGSVRSLSGAGRTYTAEIAATQDGAWSLKIPAHIAFDSAGNGNKESSDLNRISDTTPPRIVRVTSPNADGFYKAGDILTIEVTLSEVTTISGSVRLLLQTERTQAFASYQGGSTTSVLTFEYTVVEGDNSPDLDYINEHALVLEGGSIVDQAQHPLDTTLPALGSLNSLAGLKSIIIDTLAPSTPVIVSPQAGATVSARSLSISGTAEPGARLDLIDSSDNTLCSAIADESGVWSCAPEVLTDGSYSIRARAEDTVGNASVSGNHNFIVDTTVPTPPTFTEPSGGLTTDTNPRFAGTAVAGMLVHVQINGSDICTATVDSNGTWSCTSTSSLQAGRYTVEGIAEDPDDGARSSATILTLTVGGRFSGVVLMANRTQNPLTGVTISDGVNSTVTDSNGRYSLITVDADSPDITASKTGWRISRSNNPSIQATMSSLDTRWYAVPALEPETYVVWNGSLLPFKPTLRILNRSAAPQSVTATLYQADGSECSSTLSMAAGAFDYASIALDASPCFSANSFGLVKINYPSNDYDGDLTMQRGATVDSRLTSLFSLPLANGITGVSYAFVDNAYHLERGGEQSYVMLNELLISNLANVEKRFTVRRYRSNAAVSKSESVLIPARGSAIVRFPVEEERAQENGIQEILPADMGAPYTAVLIRRGEQQLQTPHKTGGFLFMDYARAGGNQNQFASVRYLPKRFAVQYAEISNISSVGANVKITRLSQRGRIRPTISIYLQPKETRKVRLSRLLENYREGMAQISSDVPNSIIVNSIMKHYRGDKKLLSIKALSIRETFGDTMYGIYERIGKTKSLLKLTNIDAQEAQGSVTCYARSQPIDVQQYRLKPGEQRTVSLERCFSSVQKGVIEVNSSQPGAIVADTLLFRRNEDIHLPGRLR